MLLLLLSFINRGLIGIPLNLMWKGSSLIPSLNPAFEFCKVTFNVSKRYCIPGKICNKAMRWADGVLKQPAAKLLGKNLTWHIILEAAKLVCSSTEERGLTAQALHFQHHKAGQIKEKIYACIKPFDDRWGGLSSVE